MLLRFISFNLQAWFLACRHFREPHFLCSGVGSEHQEVVCNGGKPLIAVWGIRVLHSNGLGDTPNEN